MKLARARAEAMAKILCLFAAMWMKARKYESLLKFGDL